MKAYMITYMKSKERVENFNLAKTLSDGNLNLFEAVDGLENYESLCEFDRKHDFHTDLYKEKMEADARKIRLQFILFSII